MTSSKSATRQTATRGGVLGAILALSLLLTGLVAPSAAAHPGEHPHPPVDRKLIKEITEEYVTEFYPLWLNVQQTRVDPNNRLIGPERISPTYRTVVAINDDTLYASTPIEVSTEPVILTVPATDDELSYSVLSLSPYGDVFEGLVPSKPAGSASEETIYALVPPGGFSGTLPSGAVVVEMPLDFSIQIFRVDKFTPVGDEIVDKLLDAEEFRRKLRIQVLSEYDPAGGGETRIVPEIVFGVPYKSIADRLIKSQPIRYLRSLQQAVESDNTPPLTPRQEALVATFDGVFGDNGSEVRPWNRRAFVKGAQSAKAALIDNYLSNRDENNWVHFTNMGEWTEDEALDRASIAEYIQYGNNISTAAYYQTFLDERGKALTGKKRGGYVLTLPPNPEAPAGAGPTAKRFWSLTAYTPKTIELIDNPINKYVVASYTEDLEKNADGSISIYVAETQPHGVPQANWLPVSDEKFSVMLRVYGVVEGSDVANNTYLPPTVSRSR